jgi:hypothetical protein
LRRIKEALERLFSHGMRVMAANNIEPREFKYEDEDDGDTHWGTADGLDFQGQTNVEVEVETGFDTDIEKKEVTRELVTLGLLNPVEMSRESRRKVARIMGAPDEITEGEDIQTASAQREWYKFKHEDRIAMVDPGLDDHEVHFMQHGTDAQSEYFRTMEEECDWDGALNLLAGEWSDYMQQAARFPPDPLPPPPAGVPPEIQASLEEEARDEVGPAPPKIAPQRALIVLWGQALTEAGFSPYRPAEGAEEDPDALGRAAETFAKVLAWRAHMAAHEIALAQSAAPAPGGQVSQSEVVQG